MNLMILIYHCTLWVISLNKSSHIIVTNSRGKPPSTLCRCHIKVIQLFCYIAIRLSREHEYHCSNKTPHNWLTRFLFCLAKVRFHNLDICANTGPTCSSTKRIEYSCELFARCASTSARCFIAALSLGYIMTD